MAITLETPVKQVPNTINESNSRSINPITSRKVAKTHATNPAVIDDLILLNTNAFLVTNEHMNEDRYRAVIAVKYRKWEMLWKDFMKYGYIAMTMSIYKLQNISTMP